MHTTGPPRLRRTYRRTSGSTKPDPLPKRAHTTEPTTDRSAEPRTGPPRPSRRTQSSPPPLSGRTLNPPPASGSTQPNAPQASGSTNEPTTAKWTHAARPTTGKRKHATDPTQSPSAAPIRSALSSFLVLSRHLSRLDKTRKLIEIIARAGWRWMAAGTRRSHRPTQRPRPPAGSADLTRGPLDLPLHRAKRAGGKALPDDEFKEQIPRVRSAVLPSPQPTRAVGRSGRALECGLAGWLA
jgi:hypothetical protein